ncbi:carcinoembryonic antigen-related cell adhesion molecule 1-like [Rana temporaria]|uniref:carcinoembryonic antigen-related cell adhesion molecule 1-like n=1 Tax=Rana temporaria TaxID=8407 RepID=UPI001AADDAAA|nr:carcinoembryonic antigen-related cell adhesion molecule 1-like [Rana temporaria]
MIAKQHSFGSSVIVSVLLGVLVDVSGGMMSIQLIPQNPVIGGSVTLSVTGITGGIRNFVWYKGPNTIRDYQILSYFPGDKDPLILGPLNNSRMTPFPDGSLQISNLNRTDEGNYIVKMQTNINQSDTPVYLKIYDMVGKPTITASTSLPKENDTVILTCTSTNAERIVWSRVPSEVTLSSDNRTIFFPRINRMNSGDYQCEAENPVSKRTSDPYTLTVAFCPTATTLCQTSGSGLGGGEIAGIVIGTVFGIFTLEVIVYFVLKAKRETPSSSVYENAHVPEQQVYERTMPGTRGKLSQESNYEELTHKDKSIYSTMESASEKY